MSAYEEAKNIHRDLEDRGELSAIFVLEGHVKRARTAALTEAHRIAQDVMRLSADTGSTGAVVGAKVVRDRIQSLIEESGK